MKARTNSVPASVAGYVILIVILTAGAAQGLSGTNTVFSDDIVDGTITSLDIKTDAVLGSRVRDETIKAADIAANAVGASEVADGAVIAGKIAADAVGATQIATDAVTSAEIANDAVGTDEIGGGTVTASEIAADAVGSSEIATGAVGAAEIATDGVGAAEVDDGSLTLDDYATAEATNLVTTTAINANSCVNIATGLTGAAVGDLAIVVLRSATAGTFWEGLRVTTAGQFPLRACNTTDSNLGSATSTIEVFTVRP